MTEPLSTQALAWLRQSVLVDGSTYSRVLLHLLERVEALEAAPVATDYSELENELFELYENHDTIIGALLSIYDLGVRRCMSTLGRRHGAAQPPTAQPAPPAAPAGGLVERVATAMHPNCYPGAFRGEARPAIREVAAWLDQQGQHGCSMLLREEVGR